MTYTDDERLAAQRGQISNPLPVEYPEHEKLLAVRDMSQAIGEFIEWMNSVKRYQICSYNSEPPHLGCGFTPISQGINQLLADYFDIDLNKVEEEKRAMLAKIRGET